VAAWRSYARGHAALRDWDLPAAEQAFRAAATADPEYAHAHLWLAQTLDWGRRTADDLWRDAATRAFALADRLPPYERALAGGQLLLAQGRFPEACDAYRRLVQRDTNDFAAWYGLGECQGSDPMVVRDAASPSGWRFRGSSHAAVRAYLRALDVMPSFHLALRGGAFARLPALLIPEQHTIRLGYAVAGDTLWFAAFPALDHDTVAFTPYARQDVFAGKPGTIPPTTAAAVAHNRDVLKGVTTNWVRTFPASADAREQLATVLETRGEIGEADSEDQSALLSARRARLLSRDAAQRLRLGVAEARLLAKLARFAEARRAADSLLAAYPQPTVSDAEQLAGAAALTGRLRRTVQLLERSAQGASFYGPDGAELRAPPPLAEAALAFLGYAALGAPAESLAAFVPRSAALVESYVEPRRRQTAYPALFDGPLRLAYPELGHRAFEGVPVGGDYLRRMQWSLDRGDSAAVTRGLDALRAQRRNIRAGDVTVDGVYTEGRLLLAVGDTAAAVRSFDQALSALPTLSVALLSRVPQAACLVRTMALRAELAAHTGDAATARRWAGAVVTLWAAADPELSPTVDRMRVLLTR